MRKTNYLIIVLLVAFSGFSCAFNKNPRLSDFDKLCGLYQEHAKDLTPEFDKIGKLIKNVEREIPRLAYHFHMMSNVDEDKKYQMYQTIAKQLTGEEWQCPVMEKYFIEQHKILQKAQSEMKYTSIESV